MINKSGLDSKDRIVALDFEMTGHSQEGFSIVEMGAVEIVDGKISRKFHTYLNPRTFIFKHALRIHGLKKSFLKTQPLFEDKIEDLLKFIGDSPVICHSAKNDLRALMHDLKESKRDDLIPLLKNWHCSQKMVSFLSKESLSLDNLCEVFLIPNNRVLHSGIEDAELLASCLSNIITHYPSQFQESHSLIFSNYKDYQAQKQITQQKKEIKINNSQYKTKSIYLGHSDITILMVNKETRKTDIPIYNEETHYLSVKQNAVMIIDKATQKVDNPYGIALIYNSTEKLETRYFKQGDRIEESNFSIQELPSKPMKM